MIPSLIKIKILALREEMFPLGSNGLIGSDCDATSALRTQEATIERLRARGLPSFKGTMSMHAVKGSFPELKTKAR